ncbi:ATP synthase protein I [Hasllibacter halocynthiae]|uniref:ATP synthase protein I n=1 Tax=Hasllibacter halocynthiae TaxID=595589 RepID=A0A2T0X3N0_9RHOB|nr:AtpZ/AtpI family protein [Hasllibacter halocynthiae]PRY93548.1 ATP synthase protein I [Hasllibacter halocynthiae]
MSDGPEGTESRMARLEAKLAEARLRHAPPPREVHAHDRAHVAWRMVIELVSGIGIGFGIGLGLDVLFGTRPFGLVLLTLLGFAAGVNVMLRTAKEIQEGTPSETEEDANGDRGV